MTKIQFIAAVSMVAVAGFGTIGCKRRNLETVGEKGNPFIITLSPSHKISEEQSSILAAKLGEKSGMEIEIRVAVEAEAAIGSASTNSADAWLLPLFDYLFCHQEFETMAGVQALRGDGKRSFKGEILVRAEEAIQDLSQLEGKRMGYVDPFSTSGFLFSAKLLKDKNINTTNVFAGSHPKVVEKLREGKVDAAATHAGDASKDPNLRAIAITDDIPNEPVHFRKGLDAEKRGRIAEALTKLSESEEVRQILTGADGNLAGITGFAFADDSAYTNVADMIQGAGKQVHDLVPSGMWLKNATRQSLADL